HPPAHRHGGGVSERAQPVPEQGQGAGDPAQPPAGPEKGRAAKRHQRRPSGPGGHRRPQREDTHLQFPAGPLHRPPHRPDRPQPRQDHGRRPGRSAGRADPARAGGKAEQTAISIKESVRTMSIETLLCPADEAGVARAAALLRQGEIIALPTEPVYGIAADARNGSAVKKIFAAKGRPQDNPLIVHIDDINMLPGLVSEFPERAQLLAAAFWPGPLTIIMPRGPEVADECCAGLDTVGIRMPSHPVVRQVIEASGCAFAAPSANLSGKPSPTTAQDVWTDMQRRLPLILDGGPCAVGVESTVVSVAGEKPVLFRPGYITLEDLERALGEEVELSPAILEKLAEGEVARSPGMKYKHYAPKADITIL